jgi:hypothetical protein
MRFASSPHPTLTIFRHASESWHPDPDSVRAEAAANQELDSSFRWNDEEK